MSNGEFGEQFDSQTPGIKVEEVDLPARPASEDDMAQPLAAPVDTVDDNEIVSNVNFEEDDAPAPASSPAAESPLPLSDVVADEIPRRNMEDEEETEAEEARVQHLLKQPIFKHVPGLNPPFTMSMPTLSANEIAALISVAERMNKQLTPEQRESILIHGTSIGLTPSDDVFRDFFENADRKLTQALKSPGEVSLTFSQPGFTEPTKGALLDAASSSAYAARLIQAYDYVYLIGYHSGMWLKVSVPARTEIHNLLNRIATKRGELGFSTRGATFSCDTALRNAELMEFIIERTTQTNMADSSPEAIRRNLAVLDIPVLAQQLACAVHPSGYPVERACSSSPGVCGHVERDILRISKLLHVDSARFTNAQLVHLETLLKRGHRKSEQDMISYRNAFGSSVRQVEIYPGFTVTFQFPMLDVYESTTEEWAAGIKRASDEVLNLMTEEEGRRHLEEQANLAVMTKYAAWVSEITVGHGFARDPLAVRRVLTQLSDKDEAVSKFTAAVSKYITDCTVAAVGVDDYVCPACKGKQATSSSGMLSAIAPIDAVSTFFTLAQLKIRQALSSDLVN